MDFMNSKGSTMNNIEEQISYTFAPYLRCIDATKPSTEYGSISGAIQCWKQPWRHYHTLENHLLPMIEKIQSQQSSVPDQFRIPVLLFAALYHDIVYVPGRTDNEQASANIAREALSSNWYRPEFELRYGMDFPSVVYEVIMSTKYEGKILPPNSTFTNLDYLKYDFFRLDCASLFNVSNGKILSNFKLVYKEFQKHPFFAFKGANVKLIGSLLSYVDSIAYRKYCETIELWKPTVGVYAGTFCPFHKGHMDILTKAERVFDKVIVARGENPSKRTTGSSNVFDLPYLQFHETRYFAGFLSDLLKQIEQEGYASVTLIRGIRNGYDLDYENTQMKFVRDQYPGLNVVYVPCSPEYSYISSTAIRALELIDKGSSLQYLP